ncbi:MAG: MATE family efflux transporter [Prevotella sp.]|nr:MATE family efflux transporter [Prevotella sp.]
MKPINREILHIALPSIVSNITVPLLGLVDVAITGHLGSAAYVGAIAIGGMLFNVVYWIFAFLRMGTSGLTSQALGAGKHEDTLMWLLRSQVLGLSIALLLLLLQVPIRELALLVMQPTEEIRTLTITYYNICIWGAPATLGLFGLNGWFIGMQNSKIPMAIAITQNVVNILASLCFVFGLGMKVEGVACGTLIAQWSGFLMGIFLCWHFIGKPRIGFEKNFANIGRSISRKKLFYRQSMSRFFEVNRDIFFRTICMVCVMLFFTSAGSWQGEVILAVNTLLMQLYLLVSYIMDGFANAGEAMSGKYYGAGDRGALQQTVRHLFGWGFLMATAFTLIYVVGGKPFLGLLTDEPSVLKASADYVWWAYLIPFVSTGAFMWDGIFIGLTASRQMLQSMFVAAVTFFVLYYLLRTPLGNHGLWTAFLGYMFVRGLVQTILYRREIKTDC